MRQSDVKAMFDYRNGGLYWKHNKHHPELVGCKAGGMSKRGYWRISINGKKYSEHRLIWLYHHGQVPSMLDHINGIKVDNRIENLRPASPIQNQANRRLNTDKNGKFKGVYKMTQRKGYEARLLVDKNAIYLGYFLDDIEAAKVYNEAAVEWYGEFAKLNEVS